MIKFHNGFEMQKVTLIKYFFSITPYFGGTTLWRVKFPNIYILWEIFIKFRTGKHDSSSPELLHCEVYS